jgi:hypothetical protein
VHVFVACVDCRTGRVLLWVSTVRPCRSIADSRTNVKTARLAARLENSGNRQAVTEKSMRRSAAVRLTHAETMP